LKNPPIEKSITVESASGKLKEGVDFSIDYKRGVLNFTEPKAPLKKIQASYSTQADIIVKRLRLSAEYLIEVNGKDWEQSDALAEQIVKLLFMFNEEFKKEGINVIPLKGRMTNEEKEKKKLQMTYLFEREMHFDTAVGIITKIEIFHKPQET
jgi:hypothetical protein